VAEEVSDYGYSVVRFTPQSDALLFINEAHGNTTLIAVPASDDRFTIDTPYLGQPAIPISPDGLTLVAPEGGEVVGLTLIDLRSGGPLVSFGDANVNYPDRFAFGLGGQLFAYGTNPATIFGGSIHVWDVYKGEMAIEIPVAPPEPESPFAAADVRPVAFTPDGRVLLVEVHRFGNDPYRLHLYDVATGDLLADLALDLDENLPLAAVTLSPDGSAIALSYGGAFCCTAEFGTRQVEWWAVR
jgi:WD40 repeat protein